MGFLKWPRVQYTATKYNSLLPPFTLHIPSEVIEKKKYDSKKIEKKRLHVRIEVETRSVTVYIHIHLLVRKEKRDFRIRNK